MKNLILGAAIVSALTATSAQAVINVDANGIPVINPTDTNILYLSGASAAVNFIEKLITDPTVPGIDKICDTTKKVWKFKDSLTGSDQNAYLCERAASNTSLPTNKPNVLVYKRSAGGSAFGVSPIIADANNDVGNATIEFLKISSACTQNTAPVAGSTLGVITCPYDLADPGKVVQHISDFGISDVDPIQFTGNNAPAGYANVTEADLALLTVKAASALTFGVPVTKNLYFALQAAQIAPNGALPASCAGSETEACMPSLTSAQIASIHAGSVVDWNQLKVGNSGLGLYAWAASNAAAYLPGSSLLHTCRRENGSGTQTQSNIKFLADPCSSVGIPAASDFSQVVGGEGEGYPMIHENNTSGSVENCLVELNDGTNAANGFDNQWGKRWAVGIQSLEKKTSAASGFRFVKLDGVAPTLANVMSGKYRDWAENTFQYSNSHKFSLNSTENAALKKLTDAIIKSAGAPEVMAALNNGFTHTFTTDKGAYLATPTNFTPEANGVFNPSRPVNVYSHAISGSAVNNCRVPTVFNNGDAKL
ncbi:MAG: hypothetical protein ABL925_06820 [Methylococcales bacterium]